MPAVTSCVTTAEPVKVYLYQKGDFESTRKDASDFAKDRYFNGYSDNCSVQENFDLITSFVQESADKHNPPPPPPPPPP